MYELIRHIRSRVPVCNTEAALILSQFTPGTVKKNDHLIRAGQAAACSAYVIQGCFRSYTTNDSGDEFTTRFAFGDWWIGDIQSLFSGEPAGLSLQALETSAILTVSKAGYDFLFANSPAFTALFRINRDKGFNKLNQLMIDRMSKTAEERYRDMIRQHPAILQRVPLKYIASYLGIKGPSLSRIRKNISHTPVI